MNTINLRSSVSGMLLSTVGLALFISGCGGEEGKPVSTPNVPAAVREKAAKAEDKEAARAEMQKAMAAVREATNAAMICSRGAGSRGKACGLRTRLLTPAGAAGRRRAGP